MSDQAVMMPAAIAVPGLKIAYQIQIGEGQALAYEAAIDSAATRPELDDLLDRLGSAAERRKAIHDLPFHRARLAQNLELLPKLRQDLAKAQARGAAVVAQKSANRRQEVPMLPQDQNAISQLEQRLLETEKTIQNDRLRIPHLQAIIAGREPPDMFPELLDEPSLMAAE